MVRTYNKTGKYSKKNKYNEEGGDDDNTHSPVADSKNKIDGNGAEAPEFGGGDEKGGSTPASKDMGMETPKPDMKKV